MAEPTSRRLDRSEQTDIEEWLATNEVTRSAPPNRRVEAVWLRRRGGNSRAVSRTKPEDFADA